MCNTCNSNGRSGANCGCNNGCGCSNNSLFNLLFGNCCNGCGCGCNNGGTFGSQRICRDACGNLRIQQCSCNSCGCNGMWNRSGCGCNGTWNRSGCGCSSGLLNSLLNSDNSCGNHCGCGSTTAQTFSTLGDCYYARQYGLTNRSSGSCCNLTI